MRSAPRVRRAALPQRVHALAQRVALEAARQGVDEIVQAAVDLDQFPLVSRCGAFTVAMQIVDLGRERAGGSLLGAILHPLSPGSRLDADYPENGVLIPCRLTVLGIVARSVARFRVIGRDGACERSRMPE